MSAQFSGISPLGQGDTQAWASRPTLRRQPQKGRRGNNRLLIALQCSAAQQLLSVLSQCLFVLCHGRVHRPMHRVQTWRGERGAGGVRPVQRAASPPAAAGPALRLRCPFKPTVCNRINDRVVSQEEILAEECRLSDHVDHQGRLSYLDSPALGLGLPPPASTRTPAPSRPPMARTRCQWRCSSRSAP